MGGGGRGTEGGGERREGDGRQLHRGIGGGIYGTSAGATKKPRIELSLLAASARAMWTPSCPSPLCLFLLWSSRLFICK